MLYNISEGYPLTPTSKGTLFSKIALRKNHNGKAFGSQLLQRRGSLRLIDLKTYLVFLLSKSSFESLEGVPQSLV